MVFNTHLGGITRTLRVAANDLDLLRLDGVRVVQFESGVLDDERPHFVAEPVRVEVSLQAQNCQQVHETSKVCSWLAVP
jgi:hypothetical protein